MSDPSDERTPRWDARRRAREAALQILYQCDVGGLTIDQAAQLADGIDPADRPALDEAARHFARTLATRASDDTAAIDARIGAAARNWRVERLAVLDRLVLRLAVAELLAHPATPPRVVLNEAIELARAFSGDEAAKFVNGVLDAVFRQLRDEGLVGE